MCDECEKNGCCEVKPTSQAETNDNVETEWKPEDSNLLKHAKRELQLLGYDLNQKEEDPNKWMVENVLELLTVFAKQGHSGSSAPYCIDVFAKLASFEPIAPLQGTDDEWDSTCSLDETWQNKRCSHIFKDKNNRAYDIQGKVFVNKDGSCYTSKDSVVYITFPYTVKGPEYIKLEEER